MKSCNKEPTLVASGVLNQIFAMKTKFLYSMICLLFLGITSCSVGDDNADLSETEAHLLGKWDLEGYTVNGTFQEASEETIIEFQRSGVLVGHFTEGEVTGTYSFSGDQLALNFPEGGEIYTIDRFFNNILKLKIEEEFDDQEGIDEVVYHYKKLPN